MRKIIGLIRKYFEEDFSLGYFIAVACFTALITWVNYKFNWETTYISYEPDPSLRLFRYCLMYFIAFGGSYALYAFSKEKRQTIFSAKLWALIIFSVFLFSFRSWFYQYQYVTEALVSPAYRLVVNKYFMNLEGLIWLFIPCGIYWWIVDRKDQPIYGFHAKGVAFKPYFSLLVLMLPLLLWASTQSDFLAMYPRAFHLGLVDGAPGTTLLTILYEFCYAADFVTTEFFFRGFLVLAFAKLAGPRSILPMCIFYVAIHFEKPLGEAISSFFGGWLLGIIAYETKSIYGGIIVHLGIALMMEVIAYAAHALI